MLEAFRNLFSDFYSALADHSASEVERESQLAYAVLLVEVMRADAKVADTERDAVITALRAKFAFDEAGVSQLMELAQRTASSANDYFRFTSNLNDQLTQAQKIRLVEDMWQVAYADAKLGECQASCRLGM